MSFARLFIKRPQQGEINANHYPAGWKPTLKRPTHSHFKLVTHQRLVKSHLHQFSSRGYRLSLPADEGCRGQSKRIWAPLSMGLLTPLPSYLGLLTVETLQDAVLSLTVGSTSSMGCTWHNEASIMSQSDHTVSLSWKQHLQIQILNEYGNISCLITRVIKRLPEGNRSNRG